MHKMAKDGSTRNGVDIRHNKSGYLDNTAYEAIRKIAVIVYFILKGWINDKMILAIPVVISSMPAAANTAIMANQYDS
ncbi:hypothetical protein ACTPEM_24880, partial [Clostridioides difficile]